MIEKLLNPLFKQLGYKIAMLLNTINYTGKIPVKA
jgi:hypothetical protein